MLMMRRGKPLVTAMAERKKDYCPWTTASDRGWLTSKDTVAAYDYTPYGLIFGHAGDLDATTHLYTGHEWAHSCNWWHGDGKGVPGDSGVYD